MIMFIRKEHDDYSLCSFCLMASGVNDLFRAIDFDERRAQGIGHLNIHYKATVRSDRRVVEVQRCRGATCLES